jgi:hypothetical protein
MSEINNGFETMQQEVELRDLLAKKNTLEEVVRFCGGEGK